MTEHVERFCLYSKCGQLIVKRHKQSWVEYAKAKTCSIPHRIEWKKEEILARGMASRKCGREFCDIVFYQVPGQSLKQFNRAKFCPEHRTRLPKDLPPKNCEICGEEFTRNVPTETIKKYEERRTCGWDCGNQISRPRGKRPRYCKLKTCDTKLRDDQEKFCCRDHKNEAQRVSEEEKRERKRLARERYEQKHPERVKAQRTTNQRRRRAGSNVVSHKKSVVRPEGISVFGDRKPTEVWRPAAWSRTG